MNEELTQFRAMLDENGIEHEDNKDVTRMVDDRGYDCMVTPILGRMSVTFAGLSCEQAYDAVMGNPVTIIKQVPITEDDLVSVRGVGPKLAEAIIAALEPKE